MGLGGEDVRAVVGGRIPAPGRAFALLRAGAPDYQSTFIHRDFQPRNVL